ncbi:MAG: N-acetylglucosaminyl-diphospho-decaprenol L-rhamnosyltransferase [Phycisphaerales bacterium]
MNHLAVVIVNYTTGPLVVDCLRSIAETTEFGLRPRVYVIDNKSPDDSADAIEHAIADSFHSFAQLIRAEKNGGFSYGNNLGIHDAIEQDPQTHAVLLLNPDTVVQPGAFTSLTGYLAAHPEAGLVGSRLLNAPEGDDEPTPQCSAFRFPSIAGDFESTAQLGVVTRLLGHRSVAIAPRDEPHECDWLSGAAVCIRREVLDAVGPMDEGYFLYFEETDYCRQARAMGYRCHHLPSSRIIHLDGQATGVVYRAQSRYPGYWFDSRRRYYIRHHGRAYAILADAASIVGTLVSSLKNTLLRRPRTSPPRFAHDLWNQGALRWGLTP